MSFWSTSINLRMQFLRHGFAVGGGVPKSPQHRTPSIGFAQHVARKAVGPVGSWWCFQGVGGWLGDPQSSPYLNHPKNLYIPLFHLYINVYKCLYNDLNDARGYPHDLENLHLGICRIPGPAINLQWLLFFNPFPVMRKWNKHEIPT